MPSQCQDMVLINLSHVFCLLGLIHISYCERRIKGGVDINDDKIYAAYLLKASVSPMRYIGWICGGAIVTEWYIITSAACVQDVKHLYAIAGYKKYVKANDIDTDECTSKTKKKVVFSCVPKSYHFEYLNIDKWAHSDIAVVKVETKYDFKDESYVKHCSYIPGPIDINYDRKYQEPGIDTIVLGWGHSRSIRKERDTNIYNEASLQYAPLLIVSKSVCKQAYNKFEKLMDTIDKYMICANGAGNLDDKGDIIDKNGHKVDGCVTDEQKKHGLRGISCEAVDNTYDEVYKDEAIENGNKTRRDLTDEDISQEKPILKEKNSTQLQETADSNFGICQNDHGGPLVTWVGSREVLIGIATAFIVNNAFHCTGPYLFTSTQCNGAFLDCIINNASHTSAKRRLCDSPPDIGFEMIRRYISWDDLDTGTDRNEVLEERHQISIQKYHFSNPEG